MASRTSNALPTFMPSGWFISVTSAQKRLPAALPISTSICASVFASSSVSISAPLPHFTSNTIFCAPEAIFLDKMEETISGIESTVAVTSRSAYSTLSAGARSPVCEMIAQPISSTVRKKRVSSIAVHRPGMDSSLSSVPPVNPSPRPDIFATFAPHAATSGTKISEVVSPTPPVECLSTVGPLRQERSSMSPECAISMVRQRVSAFVIP